MLNQDGLSATAPGNTISIVEYVYQLREDLDGVILELNRIKRHLGLSEIGNPDLEDSNKKGLTFGS